MRLDPLTAPRRTRALAALCAQLNDTQTRYPGTTLTLRYEVKEHPGTALVCLPMSGALNTGYLRGSRNSRHAEGWPGAMAALSSVQQS